MKLHILIVDVFIYFKNRKINKFHSFLKLMFSFISLRTFKDLFDVFL